jgi:hypothetical protein
MTKTVDASTTGDQLLAFGVLLARSARIIESEISGTSMGTTLPSGCRIRICPLPTEEYRPGQVVAFVTDKAIYAHRIVYRTREGVLTRGDSHSWCDLPVPINAVLGVVSSRMVSDQWVPFDDRVPFESQTKRVHRIIDALLLVCLQIDIRLAHQASRTLMLLARWRRRMITELLPPR